MNTCRNYRFIERDYWVKKVLSGSEHLHPEQVEQMMDDMENDWQDLTFRFCPDGSVTIIDNHTNQRVSPRDLSGAVLDFYIRKRIEFIRVSLEEKTGMPNGHPAGFFQVAD
ncbi:hypothetical protein P7H25_04690 [Paenibacillus larvae]|nr:hypothetical protein [Paenibacillus larvae]MDT2255082.1 hypothetical protein [Paenibacillus larvae]